MTDRCTKRDEGCEMGDPHIHGDDGSLTMRLDGNFGDEPSPCPEASFFVAVTDTSGYYPHLRDRCACGHVIAVHGLDRVCDLCTAGGAS